MKKTIPLLAQTKGRLRRFGLRARKGLGQHFLIDEAVLQNVISAAALSSSDVVVEVGPGLGVLTRELAKQAGVVLAIELDSQLAGILEQDTAPLGNVSIINADVLQVEPVDLLQEQKAKFPTLVDTSCRYKVVANLPYYISSHFLRHFFEASVKPGVMVIMVQKEVAEAIVAGPGQMSVLSVSVQFYGKPEIISYVSAECFYPVPEVDSAILRVEIYPEPAVAVTDEKSFFELVRAGFSASRKQIANSLAQGLGCSKAEALSLLAGAGLVPRRRAETLTLSEWARLWLVFIQTRESVC
ncbi:16S rRNA (adenine(1518)-N(6)/adenine(1519)-N(6))-dimethyltransferase RsmA [Chloroflexota bacterium]